jgi:hypothetical protein
LRLLAGHPFSQQQGSEDDQEELAQQLMTQLAPEQQLVAAQIMSGEQLPTFKVRIHIIHVLPSALHCEGTPLQQVQLLGL